MDGVDDSAEVGESYDNKTKRSDTSSSIDSSDSEIYPPLKNNRADQAAIASLPFADVTEGRAVLQARNYFLAAGSGPSGEGEDDAEEDGVFSESPSDEMKRMGKHIRMIVYAADVIADVMVG